MRGRPHPRSGPAGAATRGEGHGGKCGNGEGDGCRIPRLQTEASCRLFAPLASTPSTRCAASNNRLLLSRRLLQWGLPVSQQLAFVGLGSLGRGRSFTFRLSRLTTRNNGSRTLIESRRSFICGLAWRQRRHTFPCGGHFQRFRRHSFSHILWQYKRAVAAHDARRALGSGANPQNVNGSRPSSSNHRFHLDVRARTPFLLISECPEISPDLFSQSNRGHETRELTQ